MRLTPKRLLPVIAALLMSSAAHAQTRDVVDDLGRTVAIPVNPERVIALHEPLLGLPLMELGVPVVGLYGRAEDGSTLMGVDFMDTVLGEDAKALGISGIGAVGNIDLEKVRALHPDLIVGTERHRDHAAMLSPIAPVYLQNSTADGVTGFSVEADLAAALGREPAFAAAKAAYEARVAEVRAKLPADPQGRTYLAVIVFDQVSVIRDISGAIQAVRDLGYAEAPLPEGTETGRGGFSAPISSEAFVRLDPDLLVVMNTFIGDAQGEAVIRQRLDALAPGWDRFMKPAKEGRILYLDSRRVSTPTIASARHMLDAVEAWAAR
ncbi:MAG: ABC transporter substrate-binding protein [Thalassobaculaceae bacterium]|nr:ABC transporter substrate-binding protein [Thalassobaculaceae bacterium]